MTTPLISIIVPIYKAEKFIRRCLDSLLAQTHTNWETILVNDGSPDNSGVICNEYAAKDKRFKVIHQNNGGVSVARQTGLDNATGDYIIHCDPDDWIEPDMLEAMLAKAQEEDADMVICDINEEREDRTTLYSQYFPTPINAKEVQARIINDQIFGSLCNKLVKSCYVKCIKFYPTDISYCEDTLFNIRVLSQDIKAVHIPKAFYHYDLTNTSSICHSNNTKIILSRCIAISEIEKETINNELVDLTIMKRSVLDALFHSKNLKKLKNTYTEIHQEIIDSYTKYRFFTPMGYFFSKAIKGNPNIPYLLYRINLWLIHLGKKVKRMKQKRTSTL